MSTSPTPPPVSSPHHRFFTWPRLILAVLVIVLGVAYVMLPRLVDVRAVVDIAVREVESSTGRSLVIKGPVSVRVWPSLAVVAEDVTLGNAPWAADHDMAKARRVALSLNWLPLLSQSISISKAELDGLVLNLQPGSKASEGAGNWDLSPSAAPDTADRSAFQIKKLQLSDAVVHVRGRDGQLKDSVSLDKTLATFAGESVIFNGQVVWHEQALSLKGRFDDPDKGPSSLSLGVDSRGLNLSQLLGTPVTGPNGNKIPATSAGNSWWQEDRPFDFSMLPPMNLQLDLTAAQIQLANGVVLPNARLTVSINESGTGSINLERFSAGFAKGQFSASGSISDYLTANPTMNLQAHAGGFELAKLMSLPNVQPSNVSVQGGQLQLDVDLKSHGQTPRQWIANLTGHAAGSLGAGLLSFQQRAGHAAPMAVDLKSMRGRADFRAGASPEMVIHLEANQIKIGDGQSLPMASKGPGVDNRPLLSNDTPWWQDDRPIDFSGLPQVNLQLDLTAGLVQLPNKAVLPNVRLVGSVNDSGSGSINLERFASGFGQGQISASGSLNDYLTKNPSMSLRAQAGGFELAKLFSLPNMQPNNLSVQGGQVQLDVDLKANGRSPRQLMTTLTGHAAGSLGAGVLTYKESAADKTPMIVDLKTFIGRTDFKPGSSPQLMLNLDANQINLGVDPTPVAASDPSVKKGPPQKWLFNTDPLGLNKIPLMNGQVNFSVNSLILSDGIILPNWVLKARLLDTNGGMMTVDTFKSGFGQGVLMADGVISRYTTLNPGIRLRGHAQHFRLDDLIKQMDQSHRFSQIKGGAAEFAFHFEGQGSSLRSLASDLNGAFQVSVDQATIPNALVNASGDFLLNLFNTINPLRSKSDVSQLQCAVAYLPVTQGLIKIDNSVGFSTNEINTVLDGQVDLKQERMSITIQSAQKTGLTTGVNPAGLVVIQGTLLNPSLGINKTGVVKQAATVGLAVVTSGLSLAAENVMTVAMKSNPCQNVLRPWSTVDGQLLGSIQK